MLRRTPSLARPVLKWASQVTASLGATLSATLIWSAVPHPGAAPAPQPEMTSGGKFAARAVQPLAYDGLDTMPLPHVAPAPARFVTVSLDAGAPLRDSATVAGAALHGSGWNGTAGPTSASDRRASRTARPPARVEARRDGSTSPAAAPAAPTAAPAEPAAEDGFLRRMLPSSLPAVLPTIASTAREAWSVTAGAGDALVAHVVPRMP